MSKDRKAEAVNGYLKYDEPNYRLPTLFPILETLELRWK